MMGGVVEILVSGSQGRTGHLPVWPVSWAVLELSRTAVAELAVPTTQGIWLPVLLAQSPRATWGKGWWLVLQCYSGSRRPSADAAHFRFGSTASLPSQLTADMANSTRPKRPHFKYLLGKTHCPFSWGLIFRYWNLCWVLIKYLNVLHHLTKAARKVVISHCAHCAPITETHYPGTQPAAEQKVWFCSAGQDNSEIPDKAQASQYSRGAKGCSAFQSLYLTAGFVSVLLLVE